MKKNMVKVALVAVVGLIAGINMLNAQKADVLSDVAMANVEALAQMEYNPLEVDAVKGERSPRGSLRRYRDESGRCRFTLLINVESTYDCVM